MKPLGSRLLNRQTFTVHEGVDGNGDLRFLEVRDDGLIFRSVNGVIVERWWFERIINITFCPKTKVVCFGKRSGQEIRYHRYYSKKVRLLAGFCKFAERDLIFRTAEQCTFALRNCWSRSERETRKPPNWGESFQYRI